MLRSYSRLLSIALISFPLSLAAVASSAATLTADVVLDFFDSGAGPLPGPYGGTFPGNFPVAVPLSYATDGDPTTFVSLPEGSFIVLGFSGGFVFDGPGNDIFVSEVGGADELADVFVSSDFGLTFTFLGTATTDTVSGFDLASIGYTDQVNAVKVIGLDNFGGSPGFDLAFVQGMEGSVIIVPIAPIPLPASGLLLIAALGGLGALHRRNRRHARR
jgi:hypothetical protein